MDRERQIELIKSAEVRTEGYLRAWILKNPNVKAALHRSRRPKGDGQPTAPRPQPQKMCAGR
jgi:hypothetical protein